MSDKVAVGDLNSTAKGSGARKNGGKLSFSQLPMQLFAGVVRVLMGGQMKYAAWNWAKGMPWSVCFDCTIRHLFKFWYLGEEIDPESGEHHLDHALCNLMFLRHYVLSYKAGDDRPPSYADFASGMEFFSTAFDADAYCERNNIQRG